MAATTETRVNPCPQCRYDCDGGTDFVVCACCSNTYHFKCTKLSKKKFSFLRRGIGVFNCNMCTKKLKCMKCSKQSHSHLKGLYCVNCLKYECQSCLPLSSELIRQYLITKKAFYCAECSVQHFCPFCLELFEDRPHAESSIHCDSY